MSFIAGQYTVTLGASTVGQIQEGIKISHAFFVQHITGDAGAQTVQDGVFQGSECFAEYMLMEYNATAARAAFWPYGSNWLATTAQVGDLVSGFTAQLVLTALAGTPAASTPASITLPYCILRENFPVSILFHPSLRTIPINQRVYPTLSSGAQTFGTLT